MDRWHATAPLLARYGTLLQLMMYGRYGILGLSVRQEIPFVGITDGRGLTES